MINPDRLLAIYGADIDRWPDSARGAFWDIPADEKSRRRFAAEAELDRMLASAAPPIDPARERRLVEALGIALQDDLRDRAGGEPEDDWRGVFLPAESGVATCLSRGFVYIGLFVLGCVASLLSQATAAPAPFDFWISGNLLLTFGG